ncbi:MAG: AAA family ATPase [Burkholderiaceae bacterium]|nr:AAA family ATPase [Burkholderiaceae bacterium]
MQIQDEATLANHLALVLQQAGGPVAHVQTHLSHILLTPGHAYKLKKSICLPFADFSSVAARRHFCEEELRLNQRLAASLYLDVLPVLGSVQAPRLGAPGEAADSAIDWVVHMRRFASASEADALVRRGALQAPELQRFAKRLAQFHAACPVAAAGSAWGSAAQVQQAIGDVFKTLASVLDDAAAPRLQALRPVFAGLEGRWAERQAGGHVREGHGDLHLGNLVRLEGALTAFDCIEFSPALRWIDTLADAAFLTMDLHAHGRSDLAWQFLDAYLSETGDYAALAVLRPYEIYRALVRALAARLRTGQGGALACGPDYLACAEALAKPMQPRLLITHGLSGSGKSTVATALLAQAGAVRLRSDVERKRLHGLAPLADSAARGADIYTPEASERTFEHLAEQARALLQAGYPVIVDAAFLRRSERVRMHAVAQALGVPFTVLHCRAGELDLQARVQSRLAAGDDPSEADLAVLAAQQRTAEPLTVHEQALALTVNTDAPWSAADIERQWRAAATDVKV